MKELYSTKEVAAIFGLKPSFLAKQRQMRSGPKYLKIGKLVRYRLNDVRVWIDEQGEEILPVVLF